MSLYRDEAVVLRTWKLGEADRIISLYTRLSGKVRGVAKGVRRTRSKFGSRLEPACHVAVQLYRGRGELDTVTQAETINRFTRLRSDPDRFARASAMLEVVEQLSPDREADSSRHVMLRKALATLDHYGTSVVMAGFFLKLLIQEGVQPVVDCCVICGSERQLERFHLLEGGVVCRSCNSSDPKNDDNSESRTKNIRPFGLNRNIRPLKPEALGLLRLILGGGLAVAIQHPDDDIARQVTALSTEALEVHIERRLRSLVVLRDV
ncbi:MAG: DNA repair protein RecO [Acidimicrobiaceae bacterium]|nr:DNA repair protein RecO [Acidimicrobiaceae bacterium]